MQLAKQKEIIRDTLIAIQNDGKTATPDVYREYYNKVAKRAGAHVNEIGKREQEYIFLIKVMATTISKLHNKEIRELAKYTKGSIEKLAEEGKIVTISNDFVGFNRTYSRTHLLRLGKFLDIDSDDFSTIVAQLEEFLKTSSSFNRAALAKVLRGVATTSLTKRNIAAGDITSEFLSRASTFFQEGVPKIDSVMQKRMDDDRESMKKILKEMLLKTKLKQAIQEPIDNIKKIEDKLEENIKKTELDKNNIESIYKEVKGVSKHLESKVEELSKEDVKIEDVLDSEDDAPELNIDASEDIKKEGSYKVEDEKEESFILNESQEATLNIYEEEFEKNSRDYETAFFVLTNSEEIKKEYSSVALDKIMQTIVQFASKMLGEEGVVQQTIESEVMVISLSESNINLKDIIHDIKEKLTTSKFVYRDSKLSLDLHYGYAIRSASANKEEMLKDIREQTINRNKTS